MSEAWYSYGHIQFYRRHVQFICDNAVTMRDGTWPARPATGYIDPPVHSRRVKTEASFVKPGLVWAEVEVRLGRCGQDGLLAIGYFNMDWMTQWQNLPEDAIWRRINRAISYAGSGPCRRWEGCEHCRDFGECQRKKRNSLRYEEWLRVRHYRY